MPERDLLDAVRRIVRHLLLVQHLSSPSRRAPIEPARSVCPTDTLHRPHGRSRERQRLVVEHPAGVDRRHVQHRLQLRWGSPPWRGGSGRLVCSEAGRSSRRFTARVWWRRLGHGALADKGDGDRRPRAKCSRSAPAAARAEQTASTSPHPRLDSQHATHSQLTTAPPDTQACAPAAPGTRDKGS